MRRMSGPPAWSVLTLRNKRGPTPEDCCPPTETPSPAKSATQPPTQALSLTPPSCLRLRDVSVYLHKWLTGGLLLRAGGEERWRTIRWLAHHPDCQPVPDDAAGPARPAGQPSDLDDLSDYERQVLWLRVGHLLEAETGFRGGDPLRPGPGEPRPAYDPRATTLGQRRRAKAAELKALGGGEAAVLGLGQVSERTLERMAAAWKDRGPAGCIDGRWVRAGGGHPSITEEVREAIFAVRAETRKRSRTSMKDKYVLIAQYAAEHFGPQVKVPGFWTLRDVWREWFGPGGTRPRYDRTVNRMPRLATSLYDDPAAELHEERIGKEP
jgi:hypothetical protein